MRHLYWFLLWISFACCDDIAGAVVYVNASSTAVNNCGTIDNPCGSISVGVDIACSSSLGMITLLLAPGQYDINSTIEITCSLQITSSQNVTILAFNTNSTENGIYVHDIDSFSMENVSLMTNSALQSVILVHRSNTTWFNNLLFDSVQSEGSGIDLHFVTNVTMNHISSFNSTFQKFIATNNTIYNNLEGITITLGEYEYAGFFQGLADSLILSGWHVYQLDISRAFLLSEVNCTLEIENSFVAETNGRGIGNDVLFFIASHNELSITNSVFQHIILYFSMFSFRGNAAFNGVSVSHIGDIERLFFYDNLNEMGDADRYCVVHIAQCQFYALMLTGVGFNMPKSGYLYLIDSHLDQITTPSRFINYDVLSSASIEFRNNTIESSNGFYLFYVNTAGSCNITDCRFLSCSATVLMALTSTNATILRSEFIGNQGSIFLLDSSSVMSNCSFHNNIVPPVNDVTQAMISLPSNAVISNIFMTNNSQGYLLFVSDHAVQLSSFLIENNNAYGLGFSNGLIEVENIILRNNTNTFSTQALLTVLGGDFMGSNVTMINNSVYSACHVFNATMELRESLFSSNQVTRGTIFLDLSVIQITQISNNLASDLGGAIFLLKDSNSGNISNCSITGNQASSGGGIYVSGGSVIFEDLLLENNVAINGGCVSSSGGSPQFVRCLFHNCTAFTSGGGIVLDEVTAPLIINTTFSRCSASTVGSAVFGKAASNSTFVNSVITENYSRNEGAGIYLQDSANVILRNVTLSRNIVDTDGGALLLTFDSTAEVYDSLLEWNVCGSTGGAVSVLNHANITICDTIIRFNRADSAGALYASDYASISMKRNTIANNHAVAKGGAIYISDRVNLTMCDSVVTNNTAKNSAGAILLLDYACANFTNSYFADNMALYGGALYSQGEEYIRFEGCLFEHNHAIYSGGAILLAGDARTVFANCTCQLNTAATSGGCFYSKDDSNVISYDSLYRNNTATATGGAVFLADNAVWATSNNTFTENRALTGGALSVNDKSSLDSTFDTFSYNGAVNNGGAIDTSAIITLYFPQFMNNSAISGGAMSMVQNKLHLIQSVGMTAINNQAINGGALFLDAILLRNVSASSQFTNTTLLGNTAEYGGAIFYTAIYPDTPLFDHLCILSNTASKLGGGVFFGDYSAYPIMNDVVYENNTARYGGGNVAFQSISNTTASTDFCVQCTFHVQTTNTSYQDDKGFASGPIQYSFEEGQNACPSTIPLNSNGLEISVFLFDAFSTIVRGDLLEDHAIWLQFNQSSASTHVTPTSSLQRVEPDSGSATFQITDICGPNNSSFQLAFSGSFSPDYPITPAMCTVLYEGCPDGYKIEDTNPCAACKERKLPSNEIITISLIILVVFLCLLLAVLLISLSVYRHWKKAKKERFRNLVIPDLIPSGPLSLEDILKDPDILRLAWEDITLGPTIGKGASGLVTKGVLHENGKETNIAMKELILGIEDLGVEVFEEFLAEIKLMSALVHKNIVRFLGVCLTPDNSTLYLVAELMENGSVRDLLSKKGKNIGFEMRLKFAIDTSKGMRYLHDKKLIHRDLKSENLLVNNQWTCKVADFGISTVRPTITRQMTCVGTPAYMAPEVLMKNKYSEKADVFSFGILLCEIFSGERPYSSPTYLKMNQAQLMYAILEQGARPRVDMFPLALQQLITDCWNIEPKLRPSFSEIIVRLKRLAPPKEESEIVMEGVGDFYRSTESEGYLTERTPLMMPIN